MTFKIVKARLKKNYKYNGTRPRKIVTYLYITVVLRFFLYTASKATYSVLSISTFDVHHRVSVKST